MAKIFMIAFVYRGISYASNVFCQERGKNAIYHLKLVNKYPHLFTGTLILEKRPEGFRVNSPDNFNNQELLPVLIDALKKEEMA
jgi:hypothetical protein